MAPTRSDDGSGVFEKHDDRAYRYVRGMVRDSVEAEDLTQEAFLRAHRERDTVKDPGAMLSWLYRIATHVALDRLRQRTSSAARESKVDLAGLDPPDLGAPSEERELDREQMSACVQRFLVVIPDHYRSVLLMHDTHGLTGPEIAAVLDIPLSTSIGGLPHASRVESRPD